MLENYSTTPTRVPKKKKEKSRDSDERVILFVIVYQKGITLIHDIDYLMHVLLQERLEIGRLNGVFISTESPPSPSAKALV